MNFPARRKRDKLWDRDVSPVEVGGNSMTAQLDSGSAGHVSDQDIPATRDKFTPTERSAIMAQVRSRNTTPERVVRSTLHRLGYRYRLHNSRLPGKPDLTFPSRRIALFVHGCFWHRHPNCKRAATPSARQDYWLKKFERNVLRDNRNRSELERMGWTVLIVWECQLRDGGWVAVVRAALDRAQALRSFGKLRMQVNRSL